MVSDVYFTHVEKKLAGKKKEFFLVFKKHIILDKSEGGQIIMMENI